MTMDDERIRDYVAGLPDASGTFAGWFDPDPLAGLPALAPDLMPVEIDTGGQPNPAAGFLTVLTFKIGDDEWTLPVDHVDLLGGNRARVWVRRAAAE